MKKIGILIIALTYHAHNNAILVIPEVNFVKKLRKKVPQFGKVINHQLKVFSTPFLYPVENSESIQTFLPEHIASVLKKHPNYAISYWIRLHTSVENQPSIQQEFDAIDQPWSLFFHGWAFANKKFQGNQKIHWGLYEPILQTKNSSSHHNLLGSEKSSSHFHKNALLSLSLHLPKDSQFTYDKTIPLQKDRNIMNFWTVGIQHGKIVIIFECIIKEPSIAQRINKDTQGVFFSDLCYDEKIYTDLEHIHARLTDYLSTLKDNQYTPLEPFSKDLQQALSFIQSGPLHKQDILALENFILTMYEIYNREKTNPLTEETIHHLAEIYAEELHLGKHEQTISKSLSLIAPMATPDQIHRIIELAKNIHDVHLQEAHQHATKLRTDQDYKQHHETAYDDMFDSLPTLYRPYAKKIYLQTSLDENDKNSMYESIEKHEKNLQAALQKISHCAHNAHSYNEFLEQCEKLSFEPSVINDEIVQTSIFHHGKDYIETDIQNIYNTIEYALENSTDKIIRSGLKQLLKQTIKLYEKVLKLTSIKDEETLLVLANKELTSINNNLHTLFENYGNTTSISHKKRNLFNDKTYLEKTKQLAALENCSSYDEFITKFDALKIPVSYSLDNHYQTIYIQTVKKVLTKTINDFLATEPKPNAHNRLLKKQYKKFKKQLENVTSYNEINALATRIKNNTIDNSKK